MVLLGVRQDLCLRNITLHPECKGRRPPNNGIPRCYLLPQTFPPFRSYKRLKGVSNTMLDLCLIRNPQADFDWVVPCATAGSLAGLSPRPQSLNPQTLPTSRWTSPNCIPCSCRESVGPSLRQLGPSCRALGGGWENQKAFA